MAAAKFVFEGDTASLSPRQQEFLCNVLEKRGYTDNKVQIESVGKAGDNYVANVKRITVHGNDGDTFKIIAKVAPTHEMARNLVSIAALFSNEATMYNEVLPKFAELQRAANVPDEECFPQAECYGVLMEEPDELILLEDLQVSNFEMLDRFEALTNENVKIVLKNFAILHSLSFALKKKEPEVFEGFSAKLLDYIRLMNAVPEYQEYLSAMEKDTLDLLDSENYKKAVRNSVSQMSALSNKVYKMESTSRYTVVVQGDAWTNNIMFRLEENKAVAAINIDYQISRVTSPVVDLLYMIFICTDHGTRSRHYHDWIDYYHSILDKSLSNYGLKANYVYPRDQLDADLKRYSKIFFGNSIVLASMLIRQPEDAAKVKEIMESGGDVSAMNDIRTSSLDSNSISLFKQRVEDLVNSYREFGYIEH